MLQNESLIKFFFGKLQLFLTDGQKSQIHVVYLQNFSISRLKILKKMLNVLSFLVLLYVSGHFKQKKILNFFPYRLIILQKNSANKLREFVIFDYQSEKILEIFLA